MINESAVITDIQNSVGILSDETLIANHPWVDDPVEELERVKKQKEENMDLYGGAFGNQNNPDNPEVNPDKSKNNPDDND